MRIREEALDFAVSKFYRQGAMQDQIIKVAGEAVGGRPKLAHKLGLTRQAIYQWPKIPSKYVLKIEEVTGVPRHKLRPDLYPEDRERSPEPERAAS